MRIFPETASADAKRAITAKGLRAIGDGYVSIVLPAYLLELGYDAFEIGAPILKHERVPLNVWRQLGDVFPRRGKRRPAV